ncbi:hypothetical protein, partial [Roseomonas rosulenta]|uniref:hypothetical protein n=1 Tax=Roseomonas rosulenta TaxID=2748667 RepID=UPI001E3181E6
MRQFDLGGVLGAVLGGGQPARGAGRRAPARGGQDLGRALAMLAGVAIEAMTKSQPPPRAPAPAQGKPGGGWGAP